jgi:hemerythrin-like domain-containing protein
MKPRGPLMIEHRLIEKMLNLATKELDNIKNGNKANSSLINIIIDFIKTYADRTHHGKEEDILFKELMDKDLIEADQNMMEELIREHIEARKAVGDLYLANKQYDNGDTSKAKVIYEKLFFLTQFYPVHIKKEDNVFFPETEKYFSADEQEKMLNEFWVFDRKMIHEKYNQTYESLKALL